MMPWFSPQQLRTGFACLAAYVGVLCILFVLVIAPVHASPNLTPHLIEGHWYASNQLASPIKALPLTGGDFVFKGTLQVAQAGDYVIDFKNTSTFAMFKHTVLDSRNVVVAELEGGISNTESNPFTLRHARLLYLEAGTYSLVTTLKTPYLIAQPQPYLDTKAHYQQAIKLGNFIALLCLGVLMGLMAYYIVLGLIRAQMVHGMYALFVLGNLFLQGTSLLVFSDTFGIHWFYLSALPILFSNIAYVFFVKGLLNIRQQSNPKLYRWIQYAVVILVLFAVWGIYSPNWMMEMARYGVGIFLCLGLACSIYLSSKKNMTARYYLIAILTFFVLGGVTITAQNFTGYTLYVEHLGLVAVTVEALLLSFVLSYQFSELFREKEQVLAALGISEAQIKIDTLTGLPNRVALEAAIQILPESGSITILDLDRLKYYNDKFGHVYGDKLLCDFSRFLQGKLGDMGMLHRLGGDEFAITADHADEAVIQRVLDETITHLQANGFELVGVSAGTAFIYEEPDNCSVVMHMADLRMYENKRAHKRAQNEQFY
ncbi:GGDEF domain-containing protein [Methylotenera sp. L2L1]|uniref:GGDEF domain-containing protein n=1 Tax=Methylotenera sp. L2L1 TaxID=1502770 RepID=UPI00055FB0E2|nr:diguanylate cyclase [Methylotenera sp. L2L1]